MPCSGEGMSLGRFVRPVITARPDELIAEVARKLRDHHVGCVVIEREGKAFGIVTEPANGRHF